MAKKIKQNIIEKDNQTFFFVDSDGTEGCSNKIPYRHAMGFWMTEEPYNITELPKGTIFRLYNVNITFDDEPLCEAIER